MQTLKELLLTGDGLNPGVLVRETSASGVSMKILGFAEKGIFGTVQVAGRLPGEKLYFAGSHDCLLRQGQNNFSDFEFMFPFDELRELVAGAPVLNLLDRNATLIHSYYWNLNTSMVVGCYITGKVCASWCIIGFRFSDQTTVHSSLNGPADGSKDISFYDFACPDFFTRVRNLSKFSFTKILEFIKFKSFNRIGRIFC